MNVEDSLLFIFHNYYVPLLLTVQWDIQIIYKEEISLRREKKKNCVG